MLKKYPSKLTRKSPKSMSVMTKSTW